MPATKYEIERPSGRIDRVTADDVSAPGGALFLTLEGKLVKGYAANSWIRIDVEAYGK